MSTQNTTGMRGGRLRVSRSRGAMSGLLLIVLGAWGALVPFVGPYFNFAYSPDSSWTWTAARGWLEVLPGAVVAVAGLVLLVSANRLTAITAAWFAVAGGAWLVVGPELATLLHTGTPGTPTASSEGMRALESLAYFFALGAVIMFLGSVALGRLSVRSVGDVRAAERREGAVRVEAAAPVAATAPAVASSDTDGVYENVPADNAARRVPAEQNQHSHRHFGRRRHEAVETSEPAAHSGPPPTGI